MSHLSDWNKKYDAESVRMGNEYYNAMARISTRDERRELYNEMKENGLYKANKEFMEAGMKDLGNFIGGLFGK